MAVICLLLLSGIANLVADPDSENDQPKVVESMDFPGRTLLPFYWTGGNYLAYEAMGKYDANGTFVLNYSGSWVYNPYMIGRLSTEIYNYWYYTNDTAPLGKLRNQTEWIRANEKRFGDHSIWHYNFTLNSRQSDPWWSALGNAWIIATLLNSYALDKDPADLEIAWRGMKAFNYSLEDHGVRTSWNGTLWYEEEAANNTLVVQKPSHILNGMIVACSGPKYIFDFNASASAKIAFDEGIAAVNAHAKEFDTGMWERYSVLNPRINTQYIVLHTLFYAWAANASSDPGIHAWWLRTDWMKRLPALGYTPVDVIAERTVDPVNYSADYLFDKQLSLFTKARYWSAYLQSTLTIDLGAIEPVNFIGYYGMGVASSPKNCTVQTSTNLTAWTMRGAILNSTDQDKCLVFDDSIQARYVRFNFLSTVSNATVVGLDEIMIANLTADDLYEAKVSIDDHRFRNVEGRLVGTVPASTAISIDGNLTTTADDSTGSYCYSLPNGDHTIEFTYNGSTLTKTVFVKYAWTVYLNVTAQMILDQIPPVAEAGVNQSVVEGTEVTFNGSLSSDNYGVSNYTWTFNYSGALKQLYGVAPSFKFDVPGTYDVTLTVSDEGGNSDTDQMTVIVYSSFYEDLLLAVIVIMIIIGMLAPWIIVTRKRKRLREQRKSDALKESQEEQV